jgi:hypothetical protein
MDSMQLRTKPVILRVYARHYNEHRPARQDYEYQRGGVSNLFLVTEPLAGWRKVMVSDRRTRIDWAHCIKDLVDVHYPDAEQIVLVQDNPEHPHARVAVAV